MEALKFYPLLKKRKKQEYFETKSKIQSPKQVQGVNNLQDVNSQSFDCHNQPISKPANYLYILKYVVVNDSSYFFLKKHFLQYSTCANIKTIYPILPDERKKNSIPLQVISH
ncbi:hypothetical protein Avbf_14364 [Armadillidium vulgare]|nr:hypothetical protein Avbf_14364 [Armadillidium vulgare]